MYGQYADKLLEWNIDRYHNQHLLMPVSSTSENDDENQESPRTQRSRGKANQVPTYFDNSEKHHRLFQIDGINP